MLRNKVSQKRIAVLVLSCQKCHTGLSSTVKGDVSSFILDRNNSGGSRGEKNNSRGEDSPQSKKGEGSSLLIFWMHSQQSQRCLMLVQSHSNWTLRASTPVGNKGNSRYSHYFSHRQHYYLGSTTLTLCKPKYPCGMSTWSWEQGVGVGDHRRHCSVHKHISKNDSVYTAQVLLKARQQKYPALQTCEYYTGEKPSYTKCLLC